ncbi:MAG: glycosyltransferase [Candidatus Thermoplasmatota archaeon]|jgi:glycosyltransferase involved in cell wall biosynthesis|nr:glycosyltransferase [Candidatus Thermoplasmatota archaeon]
MNLLYTNVSGFHLFPQNAELMHLLKHGNNFLLPPMGIDFDSFHIGTRAGKAKFLYVSRLGECKGILFILSLWKEFNPDAEPYVIGTGGLDEQVREEVKGISGIKFIGRASRTELVETYSKCDVFLAPTTCDNFPIVVEEALSSGTHVIASDKLKGTFDPFSSEAYLSYLPLNRELWKTEILQRIENISEVRKISSDIREFARGKFDSSEVSKEFFYRVAKLVERAKRGKISDGKDQS